MGYEPVKLRDDVTLYQGDCLYILPTLAAGSVIVITDPPYGIGEANGKNASRSNIAAAVNYGVDDWDNERLGQEYISEFLRIGKELVIFGGNYYADMLPPSSSWIVWDKHNSGDFADCELAWTSHNKAVRQIDWMWNGMIRQGNEPRHHPTQKPLGVMRWIVENYTDLGDVICDPCMGSGTTGVAAVQLGRHFIGIEKRADYFAIARRRIEEAQLQMRLPL